VLRRNKGAFEVKLKPRGSLSNVYHGVTPCDGSATRPTEDKIEQREWILESDDLPGVHRLVSRDDDLEALDRIIHVVGEVDILVDRLEQVALLALT
jgi:hypothetical protein